MSAVQFTTTVIFVRGVGAKSRRNLAASAARHAQIVELRYFGGLTDDEVGDVLAVSRSTVTRAWQTARTWLYRRMTEGR